MRERGGGQRLDVVRDHVVAPEQHGARLRGAHQGQTAARAGAEIHVRVIARQADDVHDIALHLRIDVDARAPPLHLLQLVRARHGPQVLDRVAQHLRAAAPLASWDGSG